MMKGAGALGEFHASLRLLRTPRFGTFWTASLLSSIGTWVQQVTEPWLLLTLGASPFLIGVDAFAMSAPVWLLRHAGWNLPGQPHNRARRGRSRHTLRASVERCRRDRGPSRDWASVAASAAAQRRVRTTSRATGCTVCPHAGFPRYVTALGGVARRMLVNSS